jgi:hypothetical protein
MSKGPGVVGRAILATITAAPDRTFTVEDLAAAAYPGLNRPEKRHRVAILRAFAGVGVPLGWGWGRMEDKPHRAVFFNRLSVRSFGLWFIQVHGGGDYAKAVALLEPGARQVAGAGRTTCPNGLLRRC